MTLDRRGVLTAGGVVLVGSLAGCLGGDGGGGGDGGDGGDGGGGDGEDEQEASPEETESDSPTEANSSGETDADATVVVGPGGDLTFEPAELSVDPGATVLWEWDSANHTVTPTDIPSGSDWEGTGSETHDSGYTHSHTFETEGEFDYVCEPHQSAGMVGTVLVGDAAVSDGGSDSPTPTPTEESSDGGGGGEDPY